MALLHSLPFTTTSPFRTCYYRPSSASLSVTSISLSTFSFSSTHLLKSSKLQSFYSYCLPSAFAGSVADVEIEEENTGAGAGGSRLIAQNVPWSCTAEDVGALFEKYGTVVDVELSMHNRTRNRGLAFVTMGSPEEALDALNNLEGFEYDGRILKIAYAKSLKKQPRPRAASAAKLVSPYNLFIANLSYEARAKDVKELFSSDGAKVVSAEVIFHENPRKASGYGFVSFGSKSDAEAAVTTFDGKMFLDRPIRVARSKRFAKQDVTPKAKQESPTSSDLEAASA